MVALAILAASLLVVSEVAGGALRNHARAQQLHVATTLARARMVEVQAQFERKGFRDFDESEEGTFEREGHAEVRWKLDVRRPTLGDGADGVVAALTGGLTLQQLMPSPEQAPQLAPFQGLIQAQLQPMLVRIGEQLKKSVREVRLTVAWPSGATTESFDVVTHLVVLEAEEK
jgi:general secretion pathway protein I